MRKALINIFFFFFHSIFWLVSLLYFVWYYILFHFLLFIIWQWKKFQPTNQHLFRFQFFNAILDSGKIFLFVVFQFGWLGFFVWLLRIFSLVSISSFRLLFISGWHWFEFELWIAENWQRMFVFVSLVCH